MKKLSLPVILLLSLIMMALGYAIVDQYGRFKVPGEQRTDAWLPEGSEIYYQTNIDVQGVVVHQRSINEIRGRYEESEGTVLIKVFDGRTTYIFKRMDGIIFRLEDVTFPVRAVG